MNNMKLTRHSNNIDDLNQSSMDLKSEVKIANEKLKDAENQDTVIFLGNTGAGKSTTINFIKGSNLHYDEVNGFVLKDSKKQDRYIEDSLLSSGTLYAETTYDEKSKITFCDCPGFDGTRIEVKGIVETLGPILAIKKSKNIQHIAIVIDWPSVEATKAKNLKDLAIALDDLLAIQDQELINKQPITIFITKSGDLSWDIIIRKIDKLMEDAMKILEVAKNNINKIQDALMVLSIAILLKNCSEKGSLIILNHKRMIDLETQDILRESCIKSLKRNIEPISKEIFKTKITGNSFLKVNDVLKEIIDEVSDINNDIKSLPEKIKSNTKEIDKAKNLKIEYENLKRNNQKLDEVTINKTISKNEVGISNAKKANDEIQEEINKLKVKKEELDKSEPCVHVVYEEKKALPLWLKITANSGWVLTKLGKWIPLINFAMPHAERGINYLSTLTYECNYNGIPYLEAETKDSSIQPESFHPERTNGTYTAFFRGEPFKELYVKVVISAEKKLKFSEDLKKISTKLAELEENKERNNKNINSKEEIIAGLKAELSSLQGNQPGDGVKLIEDLIKRNDDELNELIDINIGLHKKFNMQQNKIIKFELSVDLCKELIAIIGIKNEDYDQILNTFEELCLQNPRPTNNNTPSSFFRTVNSQEPLSQEQRQNLKPQVMDNQADNTQDYDPTPKTGGM